MGKAAAVSRENEGGNILYESTAPQNRVTRRHFDQAVDTGFAVWPKTGTPARFAALARSALSVANGHFVRKPSCIARTQM
jgi:hypothetical protein